VPTLTVFAGPNGSGKSSIISLSEFEGKDHLLDVDAIARRINPERPELAAISAGREALQLAREYILRQEDFAVETTLSGSWTSALIQAAQRNEFYVRLLYVCVNTPERSIQRVHERVVRGGHHVPDHDVRRRYARSLVNAKELLRVVHHALGFDNSGDKADLIFEIRAGKVITKSENLPLWAAPLLE
jgi:predicted ABC-type ATPase